MSDIATIEAAAKRLSETRDDLAQQVSLLNAAIEDAKRMYLPQIKRRVQKAKERQAELLDLVNENRPLFGKPKSRIFHGVKVGWAKGKGKVSFENAEQVVKLVRKHFPEQFELLVKVTEKPNKNAIAELPAADVKRIGCAVSDTTDQAFVAFVDSDVDKLVSALLGEATEPEAEEAEAS